MCVGVFVFEYVHALSMHTGNVHKRECARACGCVSTLMCVLGCVSAVSRHECVCEHAAVSVCALCVSVQICVCMCVMAAFPCSLCVHL